MSDLVIPPGYGRVVGRVLRAVTVETGPAPLVGARVTVRPSVARVTRDGDPTPLIMGDAIECTLDDNGFLLGPDGEQGVLQGGYFFGRETDIVFERPIRQVPAFDAVLADGFGQLGKPFADKVAHSFRRAARNVKLLHDVGDGNSFGA